MLKFLACKYNLAKNKFLQLKQLIDSETQIRLNFDKKQLG